MVVKVREKNIWIYSSNVFFIKGVKALVAEIFNRRKYVVHIFDEKRILDIASVNDVPDKTFVFSDTENPLFLLCLSLYCRDNLIPGDSNIEDVRCFLLSGRRSGKIISVCSDFQRDLSLREQEIMACMKFRMTDAEIASRFKLSQKTVSTHRRNILLKLGIRNRNELYKHLFDPGR